MTHAHARAVPWVSAPPPLRPARRWELLGAARRHALPCGGCPTPCARKHALCSRVFSRRWNVHMHRGTACARGVRFDAHVCGPCLFCISSGCDLTLACLLCTATSRATTMTTSACGWRPSHASGRSCSVYVRCVSGCIHFVWDVFPFPACSRSLEPLTLSPRSLNVFLPLLTATASTCCSATCLSAAAFMPSTAPAATVFASAFCCCCSCHLLLTLTLPCAVLLGCPPPHPPPVPACMCADMHANRRAHEAPGAVHAARAAVLASCGGPSQQAPSDVVGTRAGGNTPQALHPQEALQLESRSGRQRRQRQRRQRLGAGVPRCPRVPRPTPTPRTRGRRRRRRGRWRRCGRGRRRGPQRRNAGGGRCSGRRRPSGAGCATHCACGCRGRAARDLRARHGGRGDGCRGGPRPDPCPRSATPRGGCYCC